jgi:hypothetical protein
MARLKLFSFTSLGCLDNVSSISSYSILELGSWNISQFWPVVAVFELLTASISNPEVNY